MLHNKGPKTLPIGTPDTTTTSTSSSSRTDQWVHFLCYVTFDTHDVTFDTHYVTFDTHYVTFNTHYVTFDTPVT